MDDQYSTKRLLVLRKLTRAVADHLRGQLKDHLATLSSLLRPKAVLGDLVDSGSRDAIPAADKAFKELKNLYETIGIPKPFYLEGTLEPPVEVMTPFVEVSPVEYAHVARGEART